MLHPQQSRVAARPQHKAKAVARRVPKPEPKPAVREAAKKPAVRQAKQQQQQAEPAAPTPQMRTAYSAPVPNGNGMMSGAQPVVPTGSFEARWGALR